MQIPLFHINAFPAGPHSGNPAAVCLLDSWLDDEALRKVAAENNLSATAFLVGSAGDYELRWFTPLREIRLCGHATLASGFLVCKILQPARSEITFQTRFHGRVTVRQDGDLMAMDFPAFSPTPSANVPDNLAAALRLSRKPEQVLEANSAYIVVLDSAEQVQRLSPSIVELESLHPYAVIATGPGTDADFVSRYFAPSYGVPEDPVTGSAHCALTPYWSARLNKRQLHAKQLSERGGELWCEMGTNGVILKGRAVLTMQGTLTL